MLGILTLLVLAPLSAELLSAYLGDLGGPLHLVGFVVFLAPLYGGAGLLIREVSVRAGWGWRGRLLLAAAFGVAMATLIDGSLFTAHRGDIAGWDDLHSAANWLGISWFSAVIWVLGHVAMSVAAPLAVAEGMARRPGPWLGPIGLVVTAAGFLGVAVAVNRDAASQFSYATVEVVVSVVVIAVLVALAASPWGRPLPPTRQRVPSPLLAAGLGLAAIVLVDLAVPGWIGVGWVGVVVALAVVGVLRSAASPDWNPRLTAAIGWGALLGRTLTGLLSVLSVADDRAAGLAQSGVYLVALVGLGIVLERRTRLQPPPVLPPPPRGGPGVP